MKINHHNVVEEYFIAYFANQGQWKNNAFGKIFKKLYKNKQIGEFYEGRNAASCRRLNSVAAYVLVRQMTEFLCCC